MVVSEKLLELMPEKKEELLMKKLDDIYASIIRQMGFIIFEKTAHEMIMQGKSLEEISDEYLNQLNQQLGMKIDPIFKYEWLYIPHIFHTPFYCYAYAFGNLMTLALYHKYKQDAGFLEKIENMLSLGGSKSPMEITREAGIDISKKEFWQEGFDMIKEMVNLI